MVVVVGSGLVGSALGRGLVSLGSPYRILSRAEIDYYDRGALGRWLGAHEARVMINAAGWSGRTVDDVERDPGRGLGPNVELPAMLAELCRERGVLFAHMSSGCIFHGAGPFRETDEPNFLVTEYARQKREAELRVMDACDAWIFRIRLPLSVVPHPRNLLTKLSQYRRILGGRQSVTWLEDFSMRWLKVIEKGRPGIFHAVQRGTLEIGEVARALGNEAPLWDAAAFAAEGHVVRSECELCPDKYESASGGDLPTAEGAVAAYARQMACAGQKEWQ